MHFATKQQNLRKFCTKLKGAVQFCAKCKRCVGEMALKPKKSIILGAKLSILRKISKMANFAANFSMQILLCKICSKICIAKFAQNGKFCSKICYANFALSRIVGRLILQQILRKFCNSHRTFCILSECMAVSSCGISHHPVYHPMEFRITLCIEAKFVKFVWFC